MPESIEQPTDIIATPVVPETPAQPASSSSGIGIVGWISAAFLIVLVLAAIIGPMLAAKPLRSDSGLVTQACGDGSGLPIYDELDCVDRTAANAQRRGTGEAGEFTHLLGVDDSGRDMFSRMLAGARNSLLIGFSSIAISMVIGGTLGVLAGYFGGRFGSTVVGLFDIMLAFPQIVLAFAIVAFLGPSLRNLIITFAIVSAPLLGRIARASSLTWSQREFVTAAKALGAKNGRIIVREVLPNVIPALMSITLLAMGIVIVAEGGLSILGIGLPAEDVSWGTVLAAGGDKFQRYPHLVFIPAVAILTTVMALNLLGDAIRRKFNVKEAAI